MHALFDALARHAREHPRAELMRDEHGLLTRAEVIARISAVAEKLHGLPKAIGIYADNGSDWAIAQLAGVLAGKTVVPLPTFFSPDQLGHIVRDASVECILASDALRETATRFGIRAEPIEAAPSDAPLPDLRDGFEQVIYTSGSTGRPKGVRHGRRQMHWSMTTLAMASGARADDRYLSVMPLPLLLETLCAVFVPALVGASVQFDKRLAGALGSGRVVGLAAAFDQHRPTMSVLVPDLLRIWTAELMASRQRAPSSLRYVAVGGAPVPQPVADAAWHLGIPAHEGYGLSECCSVVAVNRSGRRRPGTVGEPLPGLTLSIEQGEIVVSGPTVMDGYLGQPPVRGPWHTGDLGSLDDGYLTVRGRKDNLIVTALGRNVSPEWIETMLLADPKIAACAVVGHGAPQLTAVIVPSRLGADWFGAATAADITILLDRLCASAPRYAVPNEAVVVAAEAAIATGLLTGNGRIARQRAAALVETRRADMCAA